MRTVQRHKVDKEAYQVVYRDERPYFYRAIQAGGDNKKATFEELYPTGLTIRDRKAVPA